MKIFSFSIAFLFLLSCQNHSQKETDKASEETVSVDEDDLTLRLSMDLIANPRNRDEKERNEILNYAIDSLWDVQATSSGLYYEIASPGEGDTIKWADRVAVHYEGFFTDGKKFDSSYDRNRPLEFYVGNMIHGWNEALQLVQPKSRLRLLIPSRLAYAEEGLTSPKGDTLVPAHRVLVFKIEVLRKIQ
ncbi:MAG: FKBP-type peptidyl-prolyl cis-trans isomerase [Bacteroidota bacterium]